LTVKDGELTKTQTNANHAIVRKCRAAEKKAGRHSARGRIQANNLTLASLGFSAAAFFANDTCSTFPDFR
jgi:hypothetical protein